jgi:hypothetical protein
MLVQLLAVDLPFRTELVGSLPQWLTQLEAKEFMESLSPGSFGVYYPGFYLTEMGTQLSKLFSSTTLEQMLDLYLQPKSNI